MQHVRQAAIDTIDELLSANGPGEVSGADVLQALETYGLTVQPVAPAPGPRSIEDNTLVLPRPKLEHVMEGHDAASDFHNVGKASPVSKYKRPKDERVQALLDDAEDNRNAEQQAPREIFTDPRLRPDYRPPKK